MVTASPFTVAIADLFVAITAIELFEFLNPQSCAGTTTSTPTPPLESAVLAVFLPLAATAGLFAAVGLIHRHLHQAAAAAAGAGSRRISELVTFIMCVAVGLLEFFLFLQPAGGVDLGVAAVDALPAAATVTFFLGIILIIIHIRAGNLPVPASVGLLKKIALGAAAALLCQMAMALYSKW